MLYKSRFCLNRALASFLSFCLFSPSLSLYHSLSFYLSLRIYIYIHIYMDKEVHCTFRCVVVFSGWTCLVANSVKRWKAALTSSVIGKTLTRYSGLLWRCFRYLPKKKNKRKRKRKKKDTFSRIFSRAFLTSLYSVYYLYIFIRAYILTLYHTASTCAKYTYVLVTFWFFRQVKVVRSLATCVRLHFIWFLRLQVTYILGDKRFPACRHFFDEGEGGKGRRRLPVSTLEVAETLTKYYISAFFFFSPREIILQIVLVLFMLNTSRKRGWGEKAWLEPVLEAHRRSTWIIKRCIRLPAISVPLHFAFISRFASITRAR